MERKRKEQIEGGAGALIRSPKNEANCGAKKIFTDEKPNFWGNLTFYCDPRSEKGKGDLRIPRNDSRNERHRGSRSMKGRKGGAICTPEGFSSRLGRGGK